jgi:hypothetical protein
MTLSVFLQAFLFTISIFPHLFALKLIIGYEKDL